MESVGNDFIIVDNITKDIEALKQNKKLIQKLSDRNFGIGFNGMIFLEKSKICDYKISIINADGTEAKTSGNAIIAISKYLYENKYIKRDSFTIETNRINDVNIIKDNKSIKEVSVNLGKPSLNPKQIPVITDKSVFINEDMKILNKDYKVTCLSVGNPHAVFFSKKIYNLNLDYIGPYFNFHYRFPDKINVTIAEVINSKKINIRIYEKGALETKGCATAAAASVVASFLNDKVKRNEKIKVIQPGGTLDVTFKDNNDLIINGNSNTVYKGKILVK